MNPRIGIGVTQSLVRGHSELVQVDLDSSQGVPIPNAPGIRYYFPLSLHPHREAVQIRCVTDDLLKSKPATPSAIHLQRFFLTLATPNGDEFLKDLPVQRIAEQNIAAGGRLLRNFAFTPRLLDFRQCYVYTNRAFFGSIVFEVIYRT